MEWLFWVALIFLGLYFVGSASNVSRQRKQQAEVEKRKVESQQNAKRIRAEAEEIADRVTTIAQFRALEQRLETATDRIFALRSDKAIENAQHKADVLQAAVDLLSRKAFRYQFVPDLNLDSPRETLDRAYKVFSLKQYEEIKNEQSFNESDWEGLSLEDEEEECAIDLQGLKRFRKIIDSNASREQKLPELNQLIENHIDIFDEFIDFNSELTPADQYFAREMQKDGLPHAVYLYKQGYTTPEKCLDIDPEEFLQIQGVDENILKELLAYQTKVREDIVGRPESKNTPTEERAVFKIDMS